MRILGLDMAETTGWAVVTTHPHLEIEKSGVWVFKDGKKSLDLPVRLLQFRDALDTAFDMYSPDVVVFERAHHRGGPATRSGLGFQTVLRMESWVKFIQCIDVHSGTLKKWATGNGRASKEDMLSAVNRFMMAEIRGIQITSDDEADAIVFALWGGVNLCSTDGSTWGLHTHGCPLGDYREGDTLWEEHKL